MALGDHNTLVVLWCRNERVLRERAIASALLLQTGEYTRLILTGGELDDDTTEAERIHTKIKQLVWNSLANVHVVHDTKSEDTNDSIRFVYEDIARNKLGINDIPPISILSSNSHLARIGNYTWDLELKMFSCEQILKEKLIKHWFSSSMRQHHVKYWLYEFLRPVAKILPQSIIDCGKKVAEKS